MLGQVTAKGLHPRLNWAGCWGTARNALFPACGSSTVYWKRKKHRQIAGTEACLFSATISASKMQTRYSNRKPRRMASVADVGLHTLGQCSILRDGRCCTGHRLRLCQAMFRIHVLPLPASTLLKRVPCQPVPGLGFDKVVNGQFFIRAYVVRFKKLLANQSL